MSDRVLHSMCRLCNYRCIDSDNPTALVAIECKQPRSLPDDTNLVRDYHDSHPKFNKVNLVWEACRDRACRVARFAMCNVAALCKCALALHAVGPVVCGADHAVYCRAGYEIRHIELL